MRALLAATMISTHAAAMPGDAVDDRINRVDAWSVYVQTEQLISQFYPGNHFYIAGRVLMASFSKNPSEANAELLSLFNEKLKEKLKP